MWQTEGLFLVIFLLKMVLMLNNLNSFLEFFISLEVLMIKLMFMFFCFKKNPDKTMFLIFLCMAVSEACVGLSFLIFVSRK